MAPQGAHGRSRTAGLAMCAALVLALFAVTAHSQAFLPDTIGEALDGALFLTRFKQAAQLVGYADALEDPEFSGTIFAPVDQGFEALLQASDASWEELLAANETLAKLVKFHVLPNAKFFPLTQLRSGQRLPTAVPDYALTINRDTPGLTHVYAVSKPELDPMNFATVLQYQELKNGKAVLYVIDKVLIPPPNPNNPPPAPAAAKRKAV